MAAPKQSQTRKLTDPTLRDLLNLHTKEVMLELNCHAIATIQRFDSEKQTCTATINYKQTFFQGGTDGEYKPVLKDYPILLDVPVIILGGGAARVTFPIQKGDYCVIMFNDRDMDSWIQSGQIGPNASGRLHSFSDGIALVGLYPASAPMTGYDMDHAALVWGETMVGITASKVKIANAVESLNDILQDLMTQLQALTVVCAAPGNPSSVPVNAAALAAIATRLGALLE